jgi:hypothetical protein
VTDWKKLAESLSKQLEEEGYSEEEEVELQRELEAGQLDRFFVDSRLVKVPPARRSGETVDEGRRVG